ncbi:MAG TPA: MFS transporter [Longimicrobium sp.]|nr:MFS transporter [Longimicrobium sp.]
MGRSPLGIVFLTVFLDLVGFGIVIPLLPLYAQRFGAGAVAVAWLLAIYSLMQFLFAPAWGRLSDRIGRRPVLLVGLFGSAASYLACGLAGSLPLLFAARALNGVAGANIGVAQAYVADVTRPEERAKGMGMIGAAFGLGFIIGPALGGILSRWGFEAPFLFAAALTLANAVLAVFRLPESLPAERRAARPRGLTLADRTRALFSRETPGQLRALYLAGFLFTLAIAAAEGTFSLWADARWNATGELVAYVFVYLGVVSVVAHVGVAGRLVRGIGERRAALAGLGGVAAGMVVAALAASWPALLAGLGLMALGQGIASPAVSSLISRQGGPAEQGRVLGIFQSLSALARAAGPVAGGVALAHVSLAAPFLSASIVTAAAALVLILIAKAFA